jgi:predicted enzyme related to lactoylglutathione lyase
MPNILHFMIPADNVDRAGQFYAAIFGWTINPIVPTPDPGGMGA